MDRPFSVFTESSEDLGLLFNSYKKLYTVMNNFMNLIDDNISELVTKPEEGNIDMKKDIDRYKADINIEMKPQPISIGKIKKNVKIIRDFRSKVDALLNRLSLIKNRTAFGGNFVRSVIKRPKVYSKEINEENYANINKGIRHVNRAIDWVEKTLIDTYNLIDQDLNILTIVDKMYVRKHIYESSFNESTGKDNTLSTIWDSIGEKTPERLSQWMRKNIRYDRIPISEWTLKSPAEVFVQRCGNCHDQALFIYEMLNNIYIVAKKLFYIEFKKGHKEGGRTHTLCYYFDVNQNIYWMENSWEDAAGINGPYKNIDELKNDIIKKFIDNDDTGGYDGLLFATNHDNTLVNDCNLQTYVNSWDVDDERLYDKFNIVESTLIWMENELNSGSDNIDKHHDGIFELYHNDISDDYFIDWLFKHNEFKDIDPNDLYNTFVHDPDNGVYVYGYYVNDKIEGIIKVKEKNSNLFAISILFVNKKSQGLGIGQKLIKSVLNKFGNNEMTLNVFTDNEKAINIYKKFGFEIVDEKEVEPEPNGEGSDFIGRKYYTMIRKPGKLNEDSDDIETKEIINESYISNIPDIFNEASHGKLKFDYRMGWDYNTGHMLKVVYSLDNIDIIDIGNFYYDYAGKKVGATHDSHLDYARKNIRRKGNTDHKSKGQKVLAIVDLVTNKRLDSAKLLNPHCPGIFTRKTIQDDIVNIRKNADKDPVNFIHEIKVGEIDNKITFKSTHWATRIMDKATNENLRFRKIAKSETLKDGRGWKVNNIDAKDLNIYGHDDKYMIYHNPNKKQALTELYMREKDILNYLRHIKGKFNSEEEFKNDKSIKIELNNLRIIQRDIDIIQNGKYSLDMMKKYRKYESAVESGLSGRQTWGFDLYMDYRHAKDHIDESDDLLESIIFEDVDVSDEEKEEVIGDPPNIDNDEETKDDIMDNDISDEDIDVTIDDESTDEINEEPPKIEDEEEPTKKKEDNKKESLPKQTDSAESDKNGVRRKKLYMEFIEWAKEYNQKNTFGSVFDKEVFHVTYPFVPHEMRYFYRLANPLLCVLGGDLTFFQLSELRNINSENKQLDKMIIFAATPNDLRVFNITDKKVYIGEESNSEIVLKNVLGNTFDKYIQTMIQKGDILNAPIEQEE